MDSTDSHNKPQGTSQGSKSAPKTKRPRKTHKTPKTNKYTPKDLIIRKNYNPDLTDYTNFKNLDDQGKMSRQHAYERLRKSDYLRQDIELIKAHHREFLVREAVPKASKAIMEVLNAKKPKKVIQLDGTEVISDGLTPLQKMPAVKLVYDKYYGQEPPQTGSNTWINIMTGKCEIQTYGKAKVGEDEDK